MKELFVAGDFQRIFNIEKTRYAYVIKQVGIKPTTEVTGTGRSHKYSLKNIFQFAFAHNALSFLSVKVCIELLEYLEVHHSIQFPDLYQLIESDVKVFYAEDKTRKGYFFYFETSNVTKPSDSDYEYWLDSIKRNKREEESVSKRRGLQIKRTEISPNSNDPKVREISLLINSAISQNLLKACEEIPEFKKFLPAAKQFYDYIKDPNSVSNFKKKPHQKLLQEAPRIFDAIKRKDFSLLHKSNNQVQHYMLNLGEVKKHTMKRINLLYRE